MGKQGAPKALRFTAGSDLLEWYGSYAARLGLSLNAALLRGLEMHRHSVEGAESVTSERNGSNGDLQEHRAQAALTPAG